jgi:hypothetical protein
MVSTLKVVSSAALEASAGPAVGRTAMHLW